jgi:ketosteroid isomerase-like protein
MKPLLLFVLFLSSLYSSAQSKDEKQILAILENQTNAWNKGDIESFMKGYWQNDSLMFIGKSGVTYGYAQTLANYKKNYPDKDAMGILKFNLIKVTKLSGDAYYVIGKWHLTREKNGDIGGHYTLLFRKIKGKWVIVADHSS